MHFKWAKYAEFGTELDMLCMDYWHLLSGVVYDLDLICLIRCRIRCRIRCPKYECSPVRFGAKIGYQNTNVFQNKVEFRLNIKV